MTPRRPGRWLIAGGILGLALSPQARRAGLHARAWTMRLGRSDADPVAPFREAPCYEYGRAAAGAGGPARTEASP